MNHYIAVIKNPDTNEIIRQRILAVDLAGAVRMLVMINDERVTDNIIEIVLASTAEQRQAAIRNWAKSVGIDA